VSPSLSSQMCLSTPPVPDPYASLTPAELAAFGIGPSHASADYNDDIDDEEVDNVEEETEDD
jgi:hypothetical protein